MKNRLLKILVFLLFVSVSVETTGVLVKTPLSAIFMHAGETHNPEECKTEKEDIKDKTFQQLSFETAVAIKSSPLLLSYIGLKLSPCISLPEIPPKLS